MTYKPQPFPSFSGGLNLRDTVDVVEEDQAIDLLNVTFTERGGVEQRSGYAQLTESELTNQPDSVFPHYESDGTKQLLVGNGNRLDALATNGTSAANVATTASPHFFARFGGPTAEVTYIANGTDQVRAYNGTAFSAPAGLSGQTGKFLAVTPTSNRLVVARESGTTAGNNPSSVNFSDAGTPETFTSTNWVDLDPGDGEAIMGVVTWGSSVYVFKETKYFVFYGESTDEGGEPVFHYRKVNTGVGLVSSRTLCAGFDGVYFMDRTGVYRTRGGPPQLLSDRIEPFFLGGTSSYFDSNELNHGSITASAAAWHNDQLFLAVPTGSSTSNDRVLVYDPTYNWWSLWDFPAAALCQFRISSQPELVFAAAAGSNYVYRHSPSYRADAVSTTGTGGAAIVARWRSGWFDYGTSEVKTIRQSKLFGIGQVTVTISRDFQNTGGVSTAVTLTGNSGDEWGDGTDVSDLWGDGSGTDLWAAGSSGQPAGKLVRMAVRGAVFSTKFSNSTLNEAFSVQRLSHHLRERRLPSTVKTEN